MGRHGGGDEGQLLRIRTDVLDVTRFQLVRVQDSDEEGERFDPVD